MTEHGDPRFAAFERDREAAHRRIDAMLRGKPVERTPEQERADAAVDALLAGGIGKTQRLGERERRRRDHVLEQLEIEADAIEGQRARLEAVAQAVARSNLSTGLAAWLIDALARDLGLNPGSALP